MATSSKAGDILIWDMQSRKVINAFQHEKKNQICNLSWNPAMISQKEIAFCDCKGYLGLIENVTGQPQTDGKAQQPSAATIDTNSIGGDEDVEFSISQIKKATGFVTDEENGQDIFTGVRPSSTMGEYFAILLVIYHSGLIYSINSIQFRL